MIDVVVLDGDITIDVTIDGESESVIKVGHEIVTQSLTVTQNGVYNPDVGVDGFKQVMVNIPSPIIQNKIVIPLQTQQVVEPDDGYDYLGNVIVNGYNLEDKTITQNGIYVPKAGVDGFNSVTVLVPSPVIEPLEITENGVYEKSNGIDGYNPIIVDIPPYVPITESLLVNENGTYNAPHGIDGYNRVIVEIPEPTYQSKTVTPSTQTQNIEPDDEYDYLSSVNVLGYTTQQIEITENGTYQSPINIAGYDTIIVDLPVPTSQSKTIEPTDSQQVIVPDDGYDYLSSVTVNGYTSPTNILAYATNFGAMFNNAVVPQNFEIDFAKNTHISLSGFFRGCTGANKIVIKNLPDSAIAMGAAFRECTAKTIEFVGCTPKPSGSSQCFQSASVEEIIGAFDMSGETGDAIGLLYSAYSLKEIRFVEGTIGLTLDMNGTSKLSHDSLVSFANGLNGSVSGKELRRFAQKSATASILGTVTDGHFTEDANGDTTLADFITNTKGWTMP